ncbi:52 kDa repressor of the inhibitor of the protein kinase-like [Melanaphis sacchari]|uniref:52 kDa repressor of the inhibitor of the protein kinase-like n=1 Tax=Melanaphis sacchari TaxID=742174 RepID=UPI000DC1511C|nr:52 kDa repressor of the inhibitor of the protein kinase-like [Melanaphis sacchari]
MLEDLRQNIEKEFKSMYNEAEKMADILDINISIKRIVKKQANRANIFTEDKTIQPENYYRITIAIPYIDSFIINLKERFLIHKNILKGFQCIFSGNIDFQEFEELVHFYLNTDVQTVIAELKIWQSKLNLTNQHPTIAIDALRLCNSSIFPNVHQLLKILCTLPVSTSTPERTFSCLKRLKTYLRNTMAETRLNGLTLLSIHREVPITPEEILDIMAHKSRKIDIIL